MDHSLPESWFQDPEDAEVASAPAGDASEGAGPLASVEAEKNRDVGCSSLGSLG